MGAAEQAMKVLALIPGGGEKLGAAAQDLLKASGRALLKSSAALYSSVQLAQRNGAADTKVLQYDMELA